MNADDMAALLLKIKAQETPSNEDVLAARLRQLQTQKRGEALQRNYDAVESPQTVAEQQAAPENVSEVAQQVPSVPDVSPATVTRMVPAMNPELKKQILAYQQLLSPGAKISVGQSSQLPSESEVSSLYKLAGYDPEKVQARNEQSLSEMSHLSKAYSDALQSNPQYDLSPLYGALKFWSGKDIQSSYKPPQSPQEVVSSLHALATAQAAAREKLTQDETARLKDVIGAKTTVPGFTVEYKQPPQGQALQQERWTYGQKQKLLQEVGPEALPRLVQNFSQLSTLLNSGVSPTFGAGPVQIENKYTKGGQESNRLMNAIATDLVIAGSGKAFSQREVDQRKEQIGKALLGNAESRRTGLANEVRTAAKALELKISTFPPEVQAEFLKQAHGISPADLYSLADKLQNGAQFSQGDNTSGVRTFKGGKENSFDKFSNGGK
jgi:hypothetical protein